MLIFLLLSQLSGLLHILTGCAIFLIATFLFLMHRRLFHEETVGKHLQHFSLIIVIKDSNVIVWNLQRNYWKMKILHFFFASEENLLNLTLGKSMNSIHTICLRDLKSPKQKFLITSWWRLLVLQNYIPYCCFLLPL